MRRQFKVDLCTVYTENGMQMIMAPDGVHIPHVITTIVRDDVSRANYEIPTAKVTMFCNIAKDREDALRLYKENQEQE